MKKTSIIISIIVLFFMVTFVIFPKKDFSENENRYLSEMPEISFDGLIDGSYMKDIQNYLSDQFPFRDKFIGLKTIYEKNILLKELINNVYISKDGYCIEKFTMPKSIKMISNKFNMFAKKINANVDIMLVPTAVEIYKDKLPEFANNDSQQTAINEIFNGITESNVNKLSMYDVLYNKKDQQLYYRYDHHWTSFGAYIAACEYLKFKGFNEFPEKNLIKTVSTDFKGTIYSKLNDYYIQGEEMQAYQNNKNDILVTFEDGSTSNSIYSEEYLSQKDKYSYFLDNLHSEMTIKNNNAKTDKKIAIIKDSYANCFIPYLVDYYKEIYVFDTRYYKDSVTEFINKNKLEEVLILYNVNTIGTDVGINGIY